MTSQTKWSRICLAGMGLVKSVSGGNSQGSVWWEKEWSRVFLVGTGMGLVSEATAVELGIQTRENGKARVR